MLEKILMIAENTHLTLHSENTTSGHAVSDRK